MHPPDTSDITDKSLLWQDIESRMKEILPHLNDDPEYIQINYGAINGLAIALRNLLQEEKNIPESIQQQYLDILNSLEKLLDEQDRKDEEQREGMYGVRKMAHAQARAASIVPDLEFPPVATGRER